MDEQCALYLSIGMTWEQFWHGERGIHKIFREAEQFRREQSNYDAWLQGLYVYRAVNCGFDAFGKGLSGKRTKPLQYLDYPIAITKREKEAEKERNRQRTIRWFMSEGKDGN